jgi:hypothetical protein
VAGLESAKGRQPGTAAGRGSAGTHSLFEGRLGGETTLREEGGDQLGAFEIGQQRNASVLVRRRGKLAEPVGEKASRLGGSAIPGEASTTIDKGADRAAHKGDLCAKDSRAHREVRPRPCLGSDRAGGRGDPPAMALGGGLRTPPGGGTHLEDRSRLDSYPTLTASDSTASGIVSGIPTASLRARRCSAEPDPRSGGRPKPSLDGIVSRPSILHSLP